MKVKNLIFSTLYLGLFLGGEAYSSMPSTIPESSDIYRQNAEKFESFLSGQLDIIAKTINPAEVYWFDLKTADAFGTYYRAIMADLNSIIDNIKNNTKPELHEPYGYLDFSLRNMSLESFNSFVMGYQAFVDFSNSDVNFDDPQTFVNAIKVS